MLLLLLQRYLVAKQHGYSDIISNVVAKAQSKYAVILEPSI